MKGKLKLFRYTAINSYLGRSLSFLVFDFCNHEVTLLTLTMSLWRSWTEGKFLGSQRKPQASFLDAVLSLHTFCLSLGSLPGPGGAEQCGGHHLSQRPEGRWQRLLGSGGSGPAAEVRGDADSGQGEADGAGEPAGPLAEVSSLPSRVGSMAFNRHS